MLPTRITPNGVAKLAKLIGKFCDTSIIVQLLTEFTHPHEVIASDGVWWSPVIVLEREQELPDISLSVIRVNRALFCSVNNGTLLIDRFDVLDSTPAEGFGNPTKRVELFLNTKNQNTLPIAALVQFPRSTRISIPLRVLVTYKSCLNDPYCRHSEPMFIIHIADDSGEARVYAQEEIALELYGRFEVGKVYFIEGIMPCGHSGYFFNLANKQAFKFKNYTFIKECLETENLPKLRFNFVSIPELCNASLCKGFLHVDVLGIVYDIEPLEWEEECPLHAKLPKRKIIIIDQSGKTLTVVLWANNALDFKAEQKSIVAFRNAKLTDIRGDDVQHQSSDFSIFGDLELLSPPIVFCRILSVVSPSTFHIDPDVEECFALRQWYNSESGKDLDTTSIGTICEPC